MASLLLDSPLTEEQREFAEIIRQSGVSLLAVIGDILDFSRIESGRIDLDDEEFVVRDCVNSAIGLLAPEAAVKNVGLFHEISVDVPATVRGDSARLRQILLNLMGNAVKFTLRGKVVLTLRAEPAPEIPQGGRIRLLFTLSDTGIGIPPEAMPRLFQPFTQVDASTTRRYGGTGLGLAISRRLVEIMEGEMTAESEAGRGSVFRFSVMVGRPKRPTNFCRFSG